jgi:pimeloyl-ACP methyl ester carboxylesterase
MSKKRISDNIHCHSVYDSLKPLSILLLIELADIKFKSLSFWNSAMTAIFTPSPYSDFMQQTTVKVGDLEFHVEMGGNPDAPVVLLVMGLGAQMLLWRDWFCKGLIDAGFRVVRFDNRDIGLSSKIRVKSPRVNTKKLMARFTFGLKTEGALYDLYDLANDTKGILDALGIDKAHVIGASMGGMISQILAARYPEKVASLGLLFTSNNRALLPPPFPTQFKALMGRPASQNEVDLLKHSLRLFKAIGTPDQSSDETKIDFARTLFRRSYSPAGVMRQYMGVLSTGSLLAIDAKIKAPTVVLHGSADRLLPPAHGRAAAKAIKGSTFHLITGMAHDIPEAYTPLLIRLFTQNMRKATKAAQAS